MLLYFNSLALRAKAVMRPAAPGDHLLIGADAEDRDDHANSLGR